MKFSLSDIQRNWLSVLGVVIGAGSILAVIHFGVSNSNLKAQIQSDNAQVVKLTNEDKNRKKPKPKVQIAEQLPSIYKQAMEKANEIAASQNSLTPLYVNHHVPSKQDQSYQAAYYTLHQDINDNGDFTALGDPWNYNTNTIIRVYPGNYDGVSTYTLLFTNASKKDPSQIYDYFTAEYNTDNQMIQNFKHYSTDASTDPSKGGLESGDGTNISNTKLQETVIKDKNGKEVKAKIVPGQQPGTYTLVARDGTTKTVTSTKDLPANKTK